VVRQEVLDRAFGGSLRNGLVRATLGQLILGRCVEWRLVMTVKPLKSDVLRKAITLAATSCPPTVKAHAGRKIQKVVSALAGIPSVPARSNSEMPPCAIETWSSGFTVRTRPPLSAAKGILRQLTVRNAANLLTFIDLPHSWP
jgi:hypothetical protein